MAGVEDGVEAAHALVHLLQREIDQQDRVLGDDAEQHQQPDEHRHRDRHVGEMERDRAAERRQHQRTHVHERRHHALVEQHEHRQDEQHARDHRDDEVLDHLGLPLVRAHIDALHAVRQVAERRQCVDLLRGATDQAGREIGADDRAAALIVAR